MELIGRDAELARVRRLVQHSRGVLICGPAGVGKSALAAASAARLPEPPIARIVATTAGRSVPFGALAPVLADDGLGGHPTAVATSIARHFAGTSRPPVLVVDDLQEVDEPSAAVLLSLVANGSIKLLGTLRDTSTPSDAVVALWKENLLERIDLPPLTRPQVSALLSALLGGPVASPTVETLWRLSTGNALYLTELARYGIDRGRFSVRAGSWWWSGEQDVPPRLAELLLARVRALSPAGRAAAEALCLGDPLPYETLAEVAEPGAVDELEQGGLVVGDDTGGVLRIRFSHPLLQAVTEAALTSTRRRSLCERLRAAPSEHVDLVRKAGWELAAGGHHPRLDVLLDAADAVMLTDLGLAERLARRAAESGAGPRGLALLSHILAEHGDTDGARRSLAEATVQIGSDQDRFAVDGEDLSQQLWLLRNAAGARAAVDRLRRSLPSSFENDVESLDALALLFCGRTAAAIAAAQRVLDRSPAQSPRIRALSCLMAGHCFADQGREALAAAERLEQQIAGATLTSTRLGLIQALLATTRLLHGARPSAAPRPAGAFGRWPVAAVDPVSDDETGWPLLIGIGRHFAGDLAGAVGPLHEAVVQQLAGEGVFRSEAITELIVVLSELGRRDEAEAVLARTPPDEVAIVPGLEQWARAAVAGAAWLRAAATDHAVAAATEAARGGAVLMAWSFLTDAGRWGDARRAAAALDELGLVPTSAAARAREADVRSRAEGDPRALAAAAELQLGVGYLRHAGELAELARAATSDRAVVRAVAAVEARLDTLAGARTDRTHRRRSEGHLRLTEREAEVAHLAADGRSDKEIAELLVLSIRTVQSHLAASYRKLGVSSRTELGPLLPGTVNER